MKKISVYIIFALVLVAVFTIAAVAEEPAKTAISGQANGFEQQPPEGTSAKDPVSGQVCLIGKTTDTTVFKKKHYYFCCPGCKDVFEMDPEGFLKEKRS